MSFWPMERRTLGQREERGYSHQQGARQHTQASSHVAWSPIDLSHPETSDASWGEENEAQRDTKVLQGWQLCRVHHALSSVDQWRHTAGPVYPRPSWCGPTTAHHPPVRGHLVSVHCAPETI